MTTRISKFVVLAVALVATLMLGRPSEANVSSKRFPNDYYGPHSMTVSTWVSSPGAGSKWAFGMTTICSVPHLGIATWRASVAGNFPQETYQCYSHFYVNWNTGGGQPVDEALFTWTPQGDVESRTEYLPEFGLYGHGSAAYKTVPAGTNSSTIYSNMQTGGQYYYYSVHADDSVLHICCEEGEGC